MVCQNLSIGIFRSDFINNENSMDQLHSCACLLYAGGFHIMQKHMSEDQPFLLLHAYWQHFILHMLLLHWLKATMIFVEDLNGYAHGPFISLNQTQILNAQRYVWLGSLWLLHMACPLF